MNRDQQRNSIWLIIAASYAGILAVIILMGTIGTIGSDERRGNAVYMPLASILIALILGCAAVLLLRKSNLGRQAFLVVAPWGSLALASALPGLLWKDDIPYTALALFVYVPLVFFLTHANGLSAVAARSGGWLSRGGGILLACGVVMLVARLLVMATKPSPSGGGLLGFSETLGGLNDYVKRLVLCDVPLWNYMFALIAASLPTRFIPSVSSAAERGAPSPAGQLSSAIDGNGVEARRESPEQLNSSGEELRNATANLLGIETHLLESETRFIQDLRIPPGELCDALADLEDRFNIDLSSTKITSFGDLLRLQGRK